MSNRDCVDAIAGARGYWGRFFGLHPEKLDATITLVVPHAVLGDYAGAWVWWHGSCTVVSVPQDMVADLSRRVRMAEVEELRGVTTVTAFFGDRAGATIGPAYHGWLESRVSGREEDASVVGISPGQIAELTGLRERDPDGWRDAGLDGNADAAFGVKVTGQIVSLAAYGIDSLGAAFVRVITHPDHRRQGLGRAATGACVDHAIAHGWPCVYQTLLSNLGAIELARVVGFIEYGRHLAVRLT